MQNLVLSCNRLVAGVFGPNILLGGSLGSSLLKKKEWGCRVLPEESRFEPEEERRGPGRLATFHNPVLASQSVPGLW